MDKSEERSVRIIRKAYEIFKPEFGVRLWTGETLGPKHGPVLAINNPDFIRQAVRRPTISTIVDNWVTKGIDVIGGSLFDFAALSSGTKTRTGIKQLLTSSAVRDIPMMLFAGKPSAAGQRLDADNPYVGGSDKKAIEHHYDISNDFYRLFLDERMVYSCGYFTDFSNSIDKAQHDKLEHICRKLRLKPGEKLLDIGCGWGAMLIHAAKNHGVTGYGVSLSEQQTALARERIREAGLEDRITIDIKPYTEIEGRFDKICSIGMFEHIGHANHKGYFRTVNRLLKPGGIYLHHAITRRSKGSDRKTLRKNAEFKALLKYIFPGGQLDSIGMTLNGLESSAFIIHDVENLREHYGRTCRLWAQRLEARFDEAIAEVGEPKARLWLLYLTGCTLTFERNSAQIFQTVATRRARGPSGLPPTRADLYEGKASIPGE